MDLLLFQQIDRMRRLQASLLDAVSLRLPKTPYRIVHSGAGITLRYYQSGSEGGPLVLIVPAPIKGPAIWDLAPEVSVVRRCVDHGIRVYLAEWRAAPPHYGLAEYADRLILECLDATRAEGAVLLAHSLGGLFAAVFAALHPERVRGLGLLTAPMRFGAATPVLQQLVSRLAIDELPDSLPGSFLSAASLGAAPDVFGWDRLVDASLSATNPLALHTHYLVERWTLDEFALPRRLVAEMATKIVSEDQFMQGLLKIGARTAAPSQIAAPLLCVIDPRCTLVPPGACLPFLDAAGSREKTVLWYEGDVGVSLQHVGPLVGRRAHAHLWPQIVKWISRAWVH